MSSTLSPQWVNSPFKKKFKDEQLEKTTFQEEYAQSHTA